MITHLHHIVPKHMGGGNEPSNLVRLSIEEHAEAHKMLYEKFGIEADKIAWLTLSGQISIAEASIRAKQTPEFRAKKRAERLGKKQSPGHAAKTRALLAKYREAGKLSHPNSEETIQRIVEARSKKWFVIKPTGERIKISNLKRFCDEEGLNYSSVKRYANEGWMYRGYQVSLRE